MPFARLTMAAVALALSATTAFAETRVTYKSAKSTSSYYQMAVQLAEALKGATGGEVSLTVEESQGSVQNVMEAPRRGADYVFTSPPALIGLAQGGKAMFEGKENPAFDEIRALFPIPSLTMHFVVREDVGVASFDDLAGKTLLLGKGSFGAKEGAKMLDMMGMGDSVMLADAELSAAVPALKNEQIDGFVTAGSYPAPNVVEAASTLDVRVLSMPEEMVEKSKRTRLEIPAGTYKGQDQPVVTTSLPVVAWTTTEMDADTAYAVTKAYWEAKPKMATNAAWWNGVGEDAIPMIADRLHEGAARYYREQGWL